MGDDDDDVGRGCCCVVMMMMMMMRALLDFGLKCIKSTSTCVSVGRSIDRSVECVISGWVTES